VERREAVDVGLERNHRLHQRRVADAGLELGAGDPHHQVARVGRLGHRDVEQRGLSDARLADEQDRGAGRRHGRQHLGDHRELMIAAEQTQPTSQRSPNITIRARHGFGRHNALGHRKVQRNAEVSQMTTKRTRRE
jgi:hypothetical protein